MSPSTEIQAHAQSLFDQLLLLRQAGLRIEQSQEHTLATISPNFQASARNFLHYLAIRHQDIRPLQRELAALGLSSLGVIESHVLASLNVVMARLEDLGAREVSARPLAPVDFVSGPDLLQAHADALLGTPVDGREVRIMVTLPSAAAHDPALIQALIQRGMEVARINCAHGDAEDWQAMAQHVRAVAKAQGRVCRVQIDLAGPKSRTGSLRALGRLLKVRPKRDFRGTVLREALVWVTTHEYPQALSASGLAQAAADIPCLLFSGEGLDTLEVDDVLEVEDARRRLRSARVVQTHARGCLLSFDRVTLIAEGAELCAKRPRKNGLRGTLSDTPIIEAGLRLCVGDSLILTRDDRPGQAALLDAHGGLLAPAHLHCTLDAAFNDARVGQPVWLDDGRIGATIAAIDAQQITLRITHALPEGSKLKAEKGINFPDTNFRTAALTDKDILDLEAMHTHCDLVALSFVRQPEDITLLQTHLSRLDACHLGIVLKVENRQAFENLPRLLLAGMRSPQIGVMVARGDLAVELGFERLSEVQEEIIWLCEAAHVPVIWATQILESLAKSGAPSRPEVTDAAMSIRAECVMLNKGPHIVQALEFLIGVLARMEGHYSKRVATLRKLSIAGAIAAD
jgi:pyruvate kinase